MSSYAEQLRKWRKQADEFNRRLRGFIPDGKSPPPKPTRQRKTEPSKYRNRTETVFIGLVSEIDVVFADHNSIYSMICPPLLGGCHLFCR
jgi:hypothetical protein